MVNVRIIYDNAADRATLSTSTTAGSLVAANMQSDIKSAVWRSTSTTATITATWTVGETISGVAIPFCNLTSGATIRVRGYTNAGDSSPIFDTGTIFACPTQQLGLFGWGPESLGVNAYSYGGGVYARAWINNPANVKKLVIDLVDVSNLAGYIEASRLVTGIHWEPKIGAEQGATLTVVDTSKHYRNDAGDQMTDRGTRHRKQTFSLPSLDEQDRAKMWDILWGNGMARPVFVSVYPNSTEPKLEQLHQLYGKLITSPVMGTPYFNRQNASVDIEEI